MDLTNGERLRPKSESVSIRQEARDRSTISSAKRLAGALYIDKKKQKRKVFFTAFRGFWGHPTVIAREQD